MPIGMSKLDAVNACLQAISEYRVTALDPQGTNGTSIQADAERVVDEATRYHCSMGWPCNTRKSIPIVITAQGAVNIASNTYGLPAATLRVKGAGISQHRAITLRGSQLYDANAGTTSFAVGTIFLDVAELLAFEDCEPILKEQISAYACVIFSRRRVGSQLTDAFLSQEVSVTDALNPRAGTFFDKPIFTAPSGGKE